MFWIFQEKIHIYGHVGKMFFWTQQYKQTRWNQILCTTLCTVTDQVYRKAQPYSRARCFRPVVRCPRIFAAIVDYQVDYRGCQARIIQVYGRKINITRVYFQIRDLKMVNPDFIFDSTFVDYTVFRSAMKEFDISSVCHSINLRSESWLIKMCTILWGELNENARWPWSSGNRLNGTHGVC